jgi:hypothetical protein
MVKPHTTHTYAPLHFEDLGAGRFEDLIRQLAYDWRDWKYLDTTGLLGSDGGVDISAIELIAAPGINDDDGEPSSQSVERDWRIQCRRYKQVRPSVAEAVAEGLIPDTDHPPYGVVIAAPTDLSDRAITAFRTTALQRGAQEAHVWGRAAIEDLLYLPTNAHLLFAYFGISLGIQKRSKLQQVRNELATKRRIVRALKLDNLNLSWTLGDCLLIRDVDDNSYPSPAVHNERSSHLAVPFEIHPRYLVVRTKEYRSGWVRPDGVWDVVDAAGLEPGDLAARIRFNDDSSWELEKSFFDVEKQVPPAESAVIFEVRVLPYANVVDVDAAGDSYYECPHLVCTFFPTHGPYTETKLHFAWVFGTQSSVWLKDGLRQPLFASIGGHAAVTVAS